MTENEAQAYLLCTIKEINKRKGEKYYDDSDVQELLRVMYEQMDTKSKEEANEQGWEWWFTGRE